MWRGSLRAMVLVAACLCGFSESQSDVFQYPEKRLESKRYCGSYLVEILQFVCNGIYYSNISSSSSNGNSNSFSSHQTGQQKKSLSDTDNDLWLQLQSSEEQYKFPFRSRASATTFPHRLFKRHPGGVAYECCYSKGCTLNELRSYCGAP